MIFCKMEIIFLTKQHLKKSLNGNRECQKTINLNKKKIKSKKNMNKVY